MPDPVVAILEVADAYPSPVPVEEIIVTYEVPIFTATVDPIEYLGEVE